RVSVRTVLLKEAEPRGFVFYSNYDSRKGRDLAANAQAALCFFWRQLRRQVMIEGRAERLGVEESDAYFATRSRRAQLGAWASMQSQPLASRAELEARFDASEREYAGRDVPRPAYWGGYRLAPELIEFWAPGEGRLNERERYALGTDGVWSFGLLNP
ncbi:MAG: pyridoxamine 5'-phosphate oxidase, partial [Gammaproteobacteria bacterium]